MPPGGLFEAFEHARDRHEDAAHRVDRQVDGGLPTNSGHELIPAQTRLAKDGCYGSSGNVFRSHFHDDVVCSFWCLPSELEVAPALRHPPKPQSLQRAYNLSAAIRSQR